MIVEGRITDESIKSKLTVDEFGLFREKISSPTDSGGYPIGKWLRDRPHQKHGYTFICPFCRQKSYFLGKGEKKIGRFCTWCGKEVKGETAR